MNNISVEIISKLRFRRAKLEEELGKLIAHIEDISTTIYLLEGRTPRPSTFSPQNPFQDVPIQQIDTELYLRIATTFISQPGSTHRDSKGLPVLKRPR
jgi:hypothetical protein